MYKIYDCTYRGIDDQDALEYFAGVDLVEYIELNHLPRFAYYVDTIKGVDIYHNRGIDYYFAAEDI